MNNKILLPLLCCLLLAGCAQDKVILLPQGDGSPSAITVRAKKGGEILLDKPYATAKTTGSDTPGVSISDPADIEKRYKAVNNALPPRPRTYIVYFESGQSQLTNESQNRLAEIIRSIRSLPAFEIVVTGHTDSVGSLASNDQISRERATLIRNLMTDRGIPPGKIETIGRGKRELLIPTADNVPEARNRRVEIRVK